MYDVGNGMNERKKHSAMDSAIGLKHPTKLCLANWKRKRKKKGVLPVEGPLEEELARGLGEVGGAFVGLQHLVDHRLQPHRPLLQGVTLLQRLLEVLLQLMHHGVLALTHPRCLLLSTHTHTQPQHSTTVCH